MRFFSGVSNYKETPYIVSDTFANKVNYSAAIKGAVYIARDGASVSEPSIYQANGTTWVPIGGYGIGTDATLQDVTDNGATSNDILKLTGADGIYVDVPNKQFSLGAGNFVNSDTQGFQMVDNTYKIGDIFNLHTKTKLSIDDDDLFIQANSDSFKVLNNADNKDIANLSIAEILLTDNSGATANTLRMYLGNVGIFTTNPTYKFDVHANANNSAQGIGIRNTNAGSSATASLFIGNNTGDNQAKIFLNSSTNTGNAGESSLNIGTVANSNFGFITNNTEKMRITNSGNVGIQTTSPDCLFQAKGLNTLTANTRYLKGHIGGAANWGLNSFEELAVGYSGIRSIFNGGDNWNLIFATGTSANFETGTQVESMCITSIGNVFIGSITDNGSGAKMQVNGTSSLKATGTTYATGSLTLLSSTGINPIYLTSNGGYFALSNGGGADNFLISPTGVVSFANLGGTGSRAVLADASGVLTAPVSDISVKENIEPLNYGIAEIMALNPVSFEFIEGYKNYGEGKQIGNIAQDMYNVIPEAVFTTPSTGKMGINYDQLNGVYIKALQQLQEQIFELKAELNFLKNK
jgi:hypothetical protein